MKNLILVSICMLFWISINSIAMAGNKVLLVHSYHAGYPWVDDITKGVRKGLTGTGTILEIFYMDTKRKPDISFMVRAGKKARNKVASFKPDVIITSDDNAQVYFAKYYVGKQDPQIVFCGVNANASTYGYPASNVTGILERAYFVQSFDMLKAIIPDANSAAVITDKSPTSDQLISYMKSKRLSIKSITIDQPVTFSEWKKCIKEYQTSVDAICVIVYHTIKEKAGSKNIVAPKKVIDWTLRNNKKIIFSVAPFCVQDGAIFGVVNSGFEQGMEAARVTREILKGKKAGDFPIIKPKKGAVYLNIKTAERLGLEIPFHIIQSTDKIIH